MAGFGKTIAGLRAMSAAMDEVKSKASELAPALSKHRENVQEAKENLDVLGGLLAQSRTEQNDWSQEFEFQLQRLKLGGQTIAEFMADFGDAEIRIGDGFKSIREALDGANLDQYRQDLQQLIADVTSGGADLGKVLAFLKENAGDIAKGLINVLELFKQGKASLDDVQRVLDATKAILPGADGDALIEALRNALLGGDLGGEV